MFTRGKYPDYHLQTEAINIFTELCNVRIVEKHSINSITFIVHLYDIPERSSTITRYGYLYHAVRATKLYSK